MTDTSTISAAASPASTSSTARSNSGLVLPRGLDVSRTAIKISIIGAGFVGSTIAYTLVMRGVASDLVLVDTNTARAEGEAMDIAHGAPFAKVSSIRAGSYEDTAGSDLVIITAGTNQKPGETRLDLIQRNASIMRDVAAQVAKHSPQTVLLVVSNPVDSMSYVAQQVTGFPSWRVIGSGTVLDSSRFRYLLSCELDMVDARNIHGYVLGEHGDSEFLAWSLVNVAGMGIDETAQAFGVDFGSDKRRQMAEQTRQAAYEIIARKGATYYGIGMAATRIVEAIVRDERSIMSCSTLLDGPYGINKVYLSLPVVLGQHGVSHVFTPDLTDDEMTALNHSAEILSEAQNSVA
ncbi:MAG: L-lactate dehydrogenase [Propionibacteriaceae bacterium]|jgi:L-lactate dehydrogenase|nr:L-lactate dehydrogenase [Propionibacteriaceae bacterium]